MTNKIKLLFFTLLLFANTGMLQINAQTPITPFSNVEVKLNSSWIKQREALNTTYLHQLDPERLLHNFRVNAGLPSSAKPLEGWESPDCGLRGHFTGHYLSACATVIKNDGDALLAKRISYMVDALAECSAEPRLRNYLIVGWLMEQLTENWERHDAPRRADALYEHAYGLYGIVGITEFDLMMRIRVAQRWAMLKLRMGDNDRARELGYIQAELARWDYERGSPPSAKFV